MNETSALAIIQSIVSADEMAEIRRQLGGERIYIPARQPLDGREVCDEFLGIVHGGSTTMSAYQQLAEEHNVSPRTIMRTITGVEMVDIDGG